MEGSMVGAHGDKLDALQANYEAEILQLKEAVFALQVERAGLQVKLHQMGLLVEELRGGAVRAAA
jgi:hypothetical protein